MAITGIVYASRATRLMGPIDIDHLLIDARTNNAVTGVTGVLLYGDGQFFQYFEGDELAVEDTYRRIRASKSHSDIRELERRTFPERSFYHWFMGFKEAPPSLIQRVSHDKWLREIPWAVDHAVHSPGMRQLLEFVGANPRKVQPAA